jgi:carbamoyltransferase
LPEVNFYFEPVADDTGVSIGAAMLKYYEVTNTIPDKANDNFYHYYDSSEELTVGTPASIEDVVDMLIEGKSVAVFSGSPEAGPRALGHRSILFDPRNKETKSIVNAIKKREWYRPFAGVILEEEFPNYFDTLGVSSSPYMTINFGAKPDTIELVPGVIHVDNTCRVQTVSTGVLYDILRLFYKKTGSPILLNTSFNLAGEALVQTKNDAINTFNNSALDAVFFADDKKLLKK